MSKEARGGMTFDGMDWARQFMDRFGDKKDAIDLDLMYGWFANALMHGYDVGIDRSGNYIADKVESPMQVKFHNGRIVTILQGIEGGSYLDVTSDPARFGSQEDSQDNAKVV